MKRTLFAVLAALTLCVTMTIVCPLSLIALKSPRSSSVDLESSAPLGSSARISCGCVIRARAMAALCFCPPDTSYGYLFRSLLIPSCSAIDMIRLSISVYFLPDSTSGRKMLSFNVSVSRRLKSWKTNPRFCRRKAAISFSRILPRSFPFK